MGARSSTRWRAVPTRNRVENCMTISTKRPRPRAPMPVKAMGVWGWNQGPSLLVFWFLNEDAKTGTGRVLRLHFTRSKVPVTQTVRLTSTTPHLGGSRWWFQCPGCGRRVMNLHLPGGRLRFACRVCHNLAYESEQTNRGFTQALFRLMTWEEGGCSMRDARRILRRRYGVPMLEPELIDAASAEG